MKPKQEKTIPRNWVKKQMILDGIGGSQVMRDRRDRRAKEHKKDWKKEDWGN